MKTSPSPCLRPARASVWKSASGDSSGLAGAIAISGSAVSVRAGGWHNVPV